MVYFMKRAANQDVEVFRWDGRLGKQVAGVNADVFSLEIGLSKSGVGAETDFVRCLQSNGPGHLAQCPQDVGAFD